MPSFHNDRIARILDELRVVYETEFTVPGLKGLSGNHSLYFDFYLPSTTYQPELFLEVQDARHYGSQLTRNLGNFEAQTSIEMRHLEHDVRKILWCRQAGIPLLTMPAALTDDSARAYLQDVIDQFLGARERCLMAIHDPHFQNYRPDVQAALEDPRSPESKHFRKLKKLLKNHDIHPPYATSPPAPAPRAPLKPDLISKRPVACIDSAQTAYRKRRVKVERPVIVIPRELSSSEE